MIRFNLHKKLDAAKGELQLEVEGEIKSGEFIALFGESGVGKTSILRMLADLMKPDSGSIEVNGESWYQSDTGKNLPPQKRKIGYVFQDYALFPNMTVKENLHFALEKNQDSTIVEELIATIELQELQDRKPETLSGGQKQRVALARALVRRPEILLLDEPLSALDSKMRLKLQDYILKVHKKFELTTILVSHDMGEIFKMARRVMVLEDGKIAKQGSPKEVFGQDKISGKFRFSGTILDIQKNEVVYIVSVLIGNNIIKVIATEDEAKNLSVGDQSIVVSKAFNPLIIKA